MSFLKVLTHAKIHIVIAEVLLCNILNVWFQKHFIYAYLLKLSNFSTLVQELC